MNLETKEGMEQAVRWQTNLCNHVKEGGNWVVPRSNATYQIFNQEKRVVALDGSDEAVDLVFNKMGWKLEKNS